MGYIKLDRKLKDWEWSKDPLMMALWIRLLLETNYQDRGWQGMVVPKGTLITSVKSLAEKTGLSIQQTRNKLNHLQTTNEITIKSTNRYSLITINKWAEYQGGDEKPTNKPTNETSQNQQTDYAETNNTIRNKEEEEIKKNLNVAPKRLKKPFVKPSYEEVRSYLIANGFDQVDAQRFIDYYEKNDWTVKDGKGGRRKMSNWKNCCQTWALNEMRYNKTTELRDKAREAYIKDVELKQKREEKKGEALFK